MKAFKVKFSHGQFIDMESNQRLIPVQGQEYTIAGPDNAFKTEDSKLLIESVLSTEEKESWSKKKFGPEKTLKLLNSGIDLCFRVGNSKFVEGDESRQFIFSCTLLEDLYLYLMKGRNGNEDEDWRLAACKVQLKDCLLGNLTSIERFKSKSLNSLFANTVQFYFSMQRSASANAFSTFFLYEKGKLLTFEGAMWEEYESLGKLRAKAVKKRNGD